MGNDLETSELHIFTTFCIKSEEHFLLHKNSAFLFLRYFPNKYFLFVTL